MRLSIDIDKEGSSASVREGELCEEPTTLLDQARVAIPEEYICPVTHEVFDYPFKMASCCGQYVEMTVTMGWVDEASSHTSCPLCRAPVDLDVLLADATVVQANDALRAKIQQFLEDNPFAVILREDEIVYNVEIALGNLRKREQEQADAEYAATLVEEFERVDEQIRSDAAMAAELASPRRMRP